MSAGDDARIHSTLHGLSMDERRTLIKLGELLDMYEKSLGEIKTIRAELSALNGRRCDLCMHGSELFKGSETTECNIIRGDGNNGQCFERDFYCKSWEPKCPPPT